jgi:Phytanoyl-CoA dioxygenase (PhyH)
MLWFAALKIWSKCMVGPLSRVQVKTYAERGYLSPLRVMPEREAAAVLAELRASEARLGGRITGQMNQRPYPLFPWADALVRDPRILDAVESAIGPNIVCSGGQFFIKEADDTAFVSWHQDGSYWGPLSRDVVTAWVALTPSVPENGCMRVVPGTQRNVVPHINTFATDNLLSRGQEVAVAVHACDAVDISLRPGEMSLHHSLIVHGSEPNRSSYPRIGFAIRYAPAHLQPHDCEGDEALLVRGVSL